VEVFSTVEVFSALCRPPFVTCHAYLLASLRERIPALAH
jgi:hypothetical protein